ncbi:MAG: hypothetical protein LUG16_03525, partial [Candidatus Gastranaerophilales bacterium]|nr:hypothetical protein [Candidatus Gastranaerophilales bacterium]
FNIFKNKKFKIKKEKVKEIPDKTQETAPSKQNDPADIEENTFVTPVKRPMTKAEKEKALREEEREKAKAEKELEKINNSNEQGSWRDNFYFLKNRKKNKSSGNDDYNLTEKEPALQLTADYMEYYPEKYEIEAIGNAKIDFKDQNTTLTANKIVFNYDRNILKAHENVVLSSQDSETEGDFIKLDLNKPDGWMEKPVTKMEDIKITANEAFLYSDKIEEIDGVAKILKNEVMRFGATSFSGYVDQGGLSTNKSQVDKDYLEKGVYKLKAKTIYIDSKDDHEVITLKNADLYLKNRKIGAIPSVKIVSNKNHASMETNLPEFGSETMLGMHVGPAIVLNVPGGSTLKLAPIVTYSKEKWGLGGIARFRNEYNMTEVAYGTSKDALLIRGRQKLGPGLMLNYSKYTNQNEWFLGYRMPKYSANLAYSRSDYVKDLRLNFSQMYTAGVFVDNNGNKDFGDAEGRFRWMTQTFKPVYKYENDEGNVSLTTGLVAQTAATTYTTGDVTGLFRIGPSIMTKVGPWQQSLIYYQTAIAGNSPFEFDRYRYGRSNVVLIESIKVCKYLSLGYLASIAMNKDVKSDDTFQENRILVSVGPDYARLTIGYDSIRKNTMFLLSMLVGTEDSEVEFKKTILKNPEKFGKKNSKQPKQKKKSIKKYLKQIEEKDL